MWSRVVRRPSVLNFLHFRLLLGSPLTVFNETWHEARTQRPLPSVCFFFSQIENQRWHFLRLLSNRWPEFDKTYRKKGLNCLYHVCWLFRADGKNETNHQISSDSHPSATSNKAIHCLKWGGGGYAKSIWPTWRMIWWNIFHFFSGTAERNSKKLNMKQGLNVFYQVCVLGSVGKPGRLWPLIIWDIFYFSMEPLNRIWATFVWSKYLISSNNLCSLTHPKTEIHVTAMADQSTKMAHCTKVNEMWSPGPFVSKKFFFRFFFCDLVFLQFTRNNSLSLTCTYATRRLWKQIAVFCSPFLTR